MPLLQWAQSTGHSTQPVGIGPSPLGTFGSEQKTGDSPSPRGGSSEIPARQQRVAREGGAEGLAQNLRSLLRPIRWRGAHRGSLRMVRKTVAERRSSAVWTGGGRSGTLVR
jgi:hypothetical protein